MKTYLDFMTQGVSWLAGMIYLLIFILFVLQITLRYIFGLTWLWTPDFIRFLFIWGIFLGATALYAAEGHLKVDYFVRKFAPTKRTMLEIGLDSAAAAFFLILIVKGWEIAGIRMQVPFDTWDFPTGFAYAAVPVCGALMLLLTLGRIWQRTRTMLGAKDGKDD